MVFSKTKYQAFVDAKTHEIAREKIVLDIGGGERFQKWLAPYKDLFKDCDYKTLDVAGAGADIEGDIHAIPLPDASVDGIICHSVLEHVENPIKAMEELHRVLKPGGKLFFYVPSIYPYHARKGVYQDYWRFFDDTIKSLFLGFREVTIVKRGGYFTALSFFVPFQHRMRFMLDPLAHILDRLFRTGRRTTTAGYYVWGVK